MTAAREAKRRNYAGANVGKIDQESGYWSREGGKGDAFAKESAKVDKHSSRHIWGLISAVSKIFGSLTSLKGYELRT